MARSIPAFALSMILMALAGPVGAASTTLVWQDDFAPPGGFDVATSVATSGGRAFVAGFSGGPFNDWTVRAHDARDGRLLWSDVFDRGGRDDRAFSIATSGDAVVAAGSTRVPAFGGNFNWFVRGYDGKTGAVRWSNETDLGPRDVAIEVAIHDGHAYAAGVVGTCPEQGAPGCDFTVRVLDANTGVVLWEDRYTDAGQYAEASTIAVDGGRVFAGGVAVDGTGNPNLIVRAYDANSGSLDWQTVIDLGGFEAASQVAVAGKRLLVAGFGGPDCVPPGFGPSDCEFIVRAFDVDDGTLLWGETLDVADGFDVARSIAGSGNLVVAAGHTGPTGDWTVRAYDGTTGSLRWSDYLDTGGYDDARGGMVIQGNRVVAGGTVGVGCTNDSPFSECDLAVRAYDARTGALEWSDVWDRNGGDDGANAIAIEGDVLIAAGVSQTEFAGDADWLVRAYRLR